MTVTNEKLHKVVDEQIMVNPDTKLVISKIAKLASVSNATIHNRHPDVMDRISAHNAKFLQAASNSKKDQIRKLKIEKKQLLARIRALEEQNRKLVSINANLTLKL